MPEKSSILVPRQKIGLIVGIILFLLVLFAPTPEGMSPAAQRMAAVVLLMATWWMTEAIDIALTSLLPLALFPILGIMASDKVAPYYADHTIYLFLGGFVVALAIQKWNLHQRIALHTVCLVGTEPTRLLLGIMGAAAFLSMWMSNTACTLMLLPIGMAVVLQVAGEGSHGGQRDPKVVEHFGSVLMLGIAYGAGLGGMATLIGTPPNLVFAGAFPRLFPEAPPIGFLQWMGIGVPILVVFFPISWFYLCRFGSRIPLRQIRFSGSASVIQDELNKLGKMTRPERYVLVIWIATALLWFFRAPIQLGSFTVPGWSQLFGKPAFLQDATVAMVMALVLCLFPIKHKDPKAPERESWSFLMDWKTLQSGMPWGILLLFGGGFALAGGFEQTGLSAWMGNILSGMAGLNPVFMIFLTCFLLMALTSVTSNTAVTIVALPVLAAAAVKMGIHPFLLMIPGTLAASCAFMLPVSTPPNAIVFGSGWVTIPHMARVGVVLNVIGIFIITGLILLLGGPVFGISFTQVPAWAK